MSLTTSKYMYRGTERDKLTDRQRQTKLQTDTDRQTDRDGVGRHGLPSPGKAANQLTLPS